MKNMQDVTQPPSTCSKSIMETPEDYVKSEVSSKDTIKASMFKHTLKKSYSKWCKIFNICLNIGNV